MTAPGTGRLTVHGNKMEFITYVMIQGICLCTYKIKPQKWQNRKFSLWDECEIPTQNLPYQPLHLLSPAMARRKLIKGRVGSRISCLGLANFMALSLRNEFYMVPQVVSLKQEILVAGQLLLLSPNPADNGRAAEVALVLQSMGFVTNHLLEF